MGYVLHRNDVACWVVCQPVYSAGYAGRRDFLGLAPLGECTHVRRSPTGSGWWHWVVFNIPVTATGIPKNARNVEANLLPAGSIQSRTDFGQSGYGGPCPPAGSKPHRYQFTVYALKVDKLPLDENAPAAMVGFYLHQNLLGKAVLSARYGR